MTTLITGGTGFLGSHLARYLVQRADERVVIFDHAPARERIADVEDAVTIVRGDVLDLAGIIEAIQRHSVDKIVHLAYMLSTGLDADPSRGVRINVDGTVNVFDAARLCGIRRVVYGSSVTMYGVDRRTLDEPEVDEDVYPMPDTLYGACKQFNERMADLYTAKYGLELIGMRPTSIFGLGRGQRVTSATSAHHFMVQPEIAALGHPAVMPPDEQVFDWMYAVDAAHAFYLALTRPLPPHRVFNMASYRASHGEVTEIVRRALPDAVVTVADEPVVGQHLVSNRRLREELGFTPLYTLEEGMIEYMAAARAAAGLGPLPRAANERTRA